METAEQPGSIPKYFAMGAEAERRFCTLKPPGPSSGPRGCVRSKLPGHFGDAGRWLPNRTARENTRAS